MNLIVATTKEGRVIGNNGDMPWGTSLKSDLRHFKKITEGNIVIMGRKTYESIGKPLPDRINIILTRDENWKPENTDESVYVVESFEESLDVAHIINRDLEVFVIGGGNVYEQAMKNNPERLYITWIESDKPMEGDTFFPEFNEDLYEVIEEGQAEENDYKLTFTTYERLKLPNIFRTDEEVQSMKNIDFAYKSLIKEWDYPEDLLMKVARHFECASTGNRFLDILDGCDDDIEEAWVTYCESVDIEHEIDNNPFN